MLNRGSERDTSLGPVWSVFLIIYVNISDQGIPSGVLFLDLSKACDMVSHSHLLSKLCNLGFRWKTVNWVEFDLSERSQVTKIGTDISSPHAIKCGVPHGSILGPVLFTLYVNDLTLNISTGTISLYADDTAIVIPCRDSV